MPWVPFALVIVVAMACIPFVVRHSMEYAFAGAYFVALASILRLHAKLWRSSRQHVCADPTGLLIGDRHVPRQGLGAMRVIERPDRTTLLFERKHHPIEIDVDGEPEAKSILEALRLDPPRAVAPYVFAGGSSTQALSRLATLFVMLVGELNILHFVRTGSGTVLLLWIGLGTVCTLMLMGPAFVRVNVGADAIRFRPFMRRQVVAAYQDIESLDLVGGNLTFRLRGGRSIVLTVGGGWKRHLIASWHQGDENIRALIKCIEHHRGATRPASIGGLAALSRGGRTCRAWYEAVSALSRAPDGYRRLTMPSDALWQIVDDATQPSSTRVGAAVLLRADMDVTGRKRLRAVAEACANPRLRVALERAAQPDNDALIRALDGV